MPTLSQLEYIVAVEKYRHFGQASKACHISQPSLSMQIQKVEAEIDFVIFDRLKKPVLPTDKGARFIEQAKAVLREHAKLMHLSQSQNKELSGEFRLAVIPTLAPYLLPLFIEDFSQRYPQVQLKMEELKTSDILKRVHDDSLDAGLLATPLNEAGMTERVLFYEPFYLYVAKGNKLAARKRIKDSDLESGELWLLQDGHCLKNQIIHFCSQRNEGSVFKNIRFEGGNLETLRYLIKKSHGYTLFPHLFVANLSDAEKRDFVREFERPVPTREVSLIFRRDQWKVDIIEALEKLILQKIPAELKRFDKSKTQIMAV